MGVRNNKILSKFVRALFPRFLESVSVAYSGNNCTLIIKPIYWATVTAILKKNCFLRFDNFVDLTAVDYTQGIARFNLVVILQSIFFNARIICKTFSYQLHTAVFPTLSSDFSGSIWAEREVYDLFGIYIAGNPDLRRILTDYGFDGYPLRKDFPLSGYIEVRYDDSCASIVYETVELSQAYRNFIFSSPWEEGLC